MSINWKDSEKKLKHSLTENPKGEWWLHEPYSKIVKDSNNAHLWLYQCAYNKLTGRWHIPMKKHGRLCTFLHDQIRKRESGIVYCLNVGFKESRGGFFDSAWSDNKPDYWFVCDEYLEAADSFVESNAPPPISRVHCLEDTRILGDNKLVYFDAKTEKNQEQKTSGMVEDA